MATAPVPSKALFIQPDVASGITFPDVITALQTEGYTVDVKTDYSILPTDISVYKQVWEMGFLGAMPAAAVTAFSSFVTAGGMLYAMTENPGCCQDRNNSVAQLIIDLGGGATTIGAGGVYAANTSDYINTTYLTPGVLINFSAISAIVNSQGIPLVKDAAGNIQGMVWIGGCPGGFNASVKGTLITIPDINWLYPNATGDNLTAITDIIKGIVKGTVDGTINCLGSSGVAPPWSAPPAPPPPKIINFTFKTSQLPGTYYWTNDGPDATTDGTDFVDDQNSGSFTVTGSFSASVSPPVYNTGTFTREIKGDNKTEGPEYIHMRVRRDSVSGRILTIMNKILVNDTSIATTTPAPTTTTPSPVPNCGLATTDTSFTNQPPGSSFTVPAISGAIIHSNEYLKYSINGAGSGSLGQGGTVPGLQFDPTGTSTFTGGDFIAPGNPWEGFSFEITKGGVKSGFGGANSGSSYGSAGTTTAYTVATNHTVVTKIDPLLGELLIEYRTLPGEPIIRIRMAYKNTTGGPVTVRACRGLDPDNGGTSSTNTRGFGIIPATDIVNSAGPSGAPLSLYTPGNGFTHNSAIFSSWPSYDIDMYLSGRNDGNGDYGMGVAWDIGAVADGQAISVTCYYVCSPTPSVVETLVVGCATTTTTTTTAAPSFGGVMMTPNFVDCSIFKVGVPITPVVFTVSGGSGSYTWSISGPGDPGLSYSPLSGSSCTLSGTPTGTGPLLLLLITKLTVTDSSGILSNYDFATITGSMQPA